jgi:hypothetical protein
MFESYSRLERLKQEIKPEYLGQLVATLVLKNKTPTNSNNFADLVLRKCVTFGLYSRRAGQEYINRLVSAWHFDKWTSLVEANQNLTSEEQETWLTRNRE